MFESIWEKFSAFKYKDGVIFVLSLVLVFLIYAKCLAIAWGDYDEGVYMESAKALFLGHPLFSQVFSSQGPVFIYYISLFFHLFGVSVFAARASMIFSFLVLLFFLKLILDYFRKSKYNYFVIALLVFSATFYTFSRAVEAETPSLAVFSISLYMALLFLRYRQYRYIILSAFIYFLAFLTKLTVIYSLIPLLLIFKINSSFKEWIKYLIIFSLTCMVCLGISLLIYRNSLNSLFTQLIGTHFKASEHSLNFQAYFSALESTIKRNWYLFFLLLLSILYFIKYRIKDPFIYIFSFGFVLDLLFLLYQKPAFEHDFIILLFYPALLVSIFLNSVQEKEFFKKLKLKYLLIFFLLIFVGILVFLEKNSIEGKTGFSSSNNQVVSFIDKTVPVNGYIITDYQEIAFRANRDVPSQLVDTSYVTLQTKVIVDEDLINYFNKYKVKEVIFWSNRLLSEDQKFYKYIQSRCSIVYKVNNDQVVYGNCI